MSGDLEERYRRVTEEFLEACEKYGRRIRPKLLAVSKFHPVQSMLELYHLGQGIFGENYVQEALEKMQVFEEHGIESRKAFHIIGHIQSRKAGLICGKCALIHSLDSKKLSDRLERHLAENGLTQEVLIEVNLGDESQKTGIRSSDLEELAEYIEEKCSHLVLRGLMCLPPVFDAGERARPYFAKLREMRDALEIRLHKKLPELSMGMSGDFPWAVCEGATIVRIGTAIFGQRPRKTI